jgi:multidrug efflux pump subunit AcrA (membrane-fusion protein)
MQRIHYVLISSCLPCGLLSLVIFTGCNGPGVVAAATGPKALEVTPASEGSVSVVTVRPVRKSLLRTTTQPGRIEAFEETPVYARIEGYLRKRRTVEDEAGKPRADKAGKPLMRELADMGDRVQENELLAEIDVPDMEEQLKQKLAQVGQAEAAIEQANATIARAEADYQRAKAEHRRISELADGGSVSRKLLDEAQYQFSAAEASRREAAARLAVAKAQLKVAEADTDHLRALLKYSKVRAPFAGVITQRNVDTGHFVRPPQGGTKPLFVVARTDQVRVFTDVPPADAPLVDRDDPATVRVVDLDDAEFTDQVKCTSWVLNQVSRTLRTEIDLPNDGRLKPGMYVDVRIVLAERKGVLTLPAASIFRDGDQTYCWCAEDGKACRKSIQLGLRVDNDVEIISGLSEDELVIRSSAAPLAQGQAVIAGAS